MLIAYVVDCRIVYLLNSF